MEQASNAPIATSGEYVDRAPTAVWKLLAVLALPVALIVDWVGLRLYVDGMLQRAHPSPRAPQLGNIHLVWACLALYLSTVLFTLGLAALVPRYPRRAFSAIGWLACLGLVSLALMVPYTFVWMSQSAPDEGAVLEPGMDSWESSGDQSEDAPMPEDRF
jgi:hypothetical protein